jgi:DNA-binding response OmpR family regulator
MAKKKIVWVEDDDDIISAFRPRIESQGWELVSASSAEKGKSLALEVKPDLIIMDIIMAGEHGYAAIEELKSESSLANVPIIVFTSVTHRWSETTATRADGLLTEADEFVDKLEKPDVLLGAISKYLNK